MVVKVGEKWIVISDSKKYVGTYDTENKAIRQDEFEKKIEKEIKNIKKV